MPAALFTLLSSEIESIDTKVNDVALKKQYNANFRWVGNGR